MAYKGETWNESEAYRDTWTLRQVRRVTTAGLYNETPNYHTNIGFTADGEFLIFAACREGRSAVFQCHVPTGDITQLTESAEGMSIGGGGLCIAPRSRWAVYKLGGSLRAVHLDTLVERELYQCAYGWSGSIPSVSADESFVILPTNPIPPDMLAGRRPLKTPMEYYAEPGGSHLKLVKIPLDGGPSSIVYDEPGCRSNHCPHSPTDSDLLLLDRDLPPRFWSGSDGRTNRIWVLRISTGELTELPPQDKARFQVHCAWTFDGERIVYHGRSAISGHYIGVIDKHGHTVREYGFYGTAHYGHVAAMAGRPAIIIDGNLSPDLMQWVYYDQEQPRIEVICRHGTDWNALGGQFPHPHPLSDPTGRWISFNVGARGRSDVYIVKV